MTRLRLLVLGMISLVTAVCSADSPMDRGALHFAGKYSIAEIQNRASMPTLRQLIIRSSSSPDRSKLPTNPLSPRSSTFPIQTNDSTVRSMPGGDDATFQRRFSIGTSFDGPNRTAPIDPADTTGDVSPTQIFVATNDNIACYDKAGNLGLISQTLDSFFSPGQTATSQFTSTPRVRFDRTSGRWILTCLDNVSGTGVNNRCIIAISSGSVINASSTFTYFWFTPRLTSNRLEYPTLGVDSNALYIGGNMFSSTSVYAGSDAYVIPKAQLTTLSGGSPLSVFSSQVCTATGEGPFTPQGVVDGDTSVSRGYFIGVSNIAFGRLVVRRVSNPGTSPSLSSNLLVTVPTTADPGITVSTPGGGLSALDDRLFNATYFNNNIYCAHNFRVDVNKVATNSGTLMATRWYQIGNVSTTPSLVQSGTLSQSFNGASVWIPSIAANLQGHVAISMSRANTTLTPETAYAYRNSTDSLGSTFGPNLGTVGNGVFTPQANRWGEYSNVVVDPSDGMTFWMFQTYVPSAGKWGSRVQQLKSNPMSLTSLSPTSGTEGETLDVTITGKNLFDPGPGYPNRLKFFISANITINSVTFVNTTTAVANITIPYTVPEANYLAIVTNPDGSDDNSFFQVHSTPKTVSGTLNLQGYTGPPLSASDFVVELRSQGNTLLETENITLDQNYNFSFVTNQAAGNYRLRIKGVNRFLSRRLIFDIGSFGTSGLAFTLLNGDANGDNVVGTADFNLLRSAFGGVAPDSPYLQAADFNGDGVVGTADFNILRANFGFIGDA